MIEYVEGDDELDEELEEDIEDFSGLPSKESYLEDDDHGNIHPPPCSYFFTILTQILKFMHLNLEQLFNSCNRFECI